MTVKILKFGGSSIADADKIRHVSGIIEDALSHNTIRGAAGGAILTAELLVHKGYILL